MGTKELTSKVTELKELKVMADELAQEITAIEDEIKAEMTARQVDELNAGCFIVKWKTIISNRFDSKAFKEAHGDMYSMFTKPFESRRFTVA